MRLCSFLLQVISFWKDLNWPDREQSHAWFVIVVKVRNPYLISINSTPLFPQGLCDLAMFYTEVLHQKLQDEDLTDTDAGKFKITDKVNSPHSNFFKFHSHYSCVLH